MSDDTARVLWYSMAELFSDSVEVSDDDPLARPVLSDEELEAGAVLGFTPEQARVILSDRPTRRELARTWFDYAKASDFWREQGESQDLPTIPRQIAKRLAEEEQSGGAQWHAVLRGISGFSIIWDEKWPDIVGSLPASALAHLSEDEREGFVGVQRRWVEAVRETKMAGALLARGPASARWRDDDWDTLGSGFDVLAGAKLDDDILYVGALCETESATVMVKMWWPDGSSLVAPIRCDQPGQPGSIEIDAQGHTDPPARIVVRKKR